MLRVRALWATFWSAADVLLRQGLQFGVSVVLARLLAPEQFGAFAIIMTFTALAGVFIDSGFAAALIQRRQATATDESTVFWFNLGVATLLATALGIAGPWIGEFFHLKDLAPTIWMMSASLVVSAAGGIHMTLLSKQLDFSVQMRASVAAMLVSGALSIWLAYAGWGVMALAAQALASAVVTTAVLWILHRWRPSLVFSLASLRSMFGFGSFMMLSILLDTIEARASALVIGRAYSPRELGFYARADSTRQLPSSLIQRIAARVALPAFAHAADDVDRLRSGMRQGLVGLMFVNTPAMVGLAAVADPLVRALFGERWAPAAPLLQILALAGVAVPVHIVNSNAIMALGRSALLFRLHLARKAITLGLLAVAAPFGPAAIAWSVAGGSLLGLLIDAIGPSRLVRYPVLRQLWDVTPVLAASAVMGAGVWLMQSVMPFGDWASLLLCAATGAAAYGLLCWVLRVAPLMQALRAAMARLARVPGSGAVGP